MEQPSPQLSSHLPIRLIRLLAILIVGAACLLTASESGVVSAQSNSKPFTLPFRSGPSPSTWLFEQPFGNTADAYNFGKYWYRAGQGLHFGLDFEAPCGTEITAAADGVIAFIDNPLFGADPHTVAIRHDDLGYVTVYGHLRARSILKPGQPVRRGDVVGISGDPDLTCESRPHLHFEIRSLNLAIAYNPITLINADWDRLYSLHQPDWGGFARDLYNPRQWQTLTDQPDVNFNGYIVNGFAASWLPAYRMQPPTLTLPAYQAATPTDTPTLIRITNTACCARAWFVSSQQPNRGTIRYLDGVDGDLAGVYETVLNGEGGFMSRRVEDAPPSLTAPNGQHTIRRTANGTLLNVAGKDGVNRQIPVPSRAAWPQFSPDSRWILWHVRPGDEIPGYRAPLTEIFIARVPTGDSLLEPMLVRTQRGGSVRWLDSNRLLLIDVEVRTNNATMTIFNLVTNSFTELTTVRFMRALSVSPGGEYLMFYLQFQDGDGEQVTSRQDGIHLLRTEPGAQPVKLPFFGGYRWRDSKSVVYIPFGSSKMQFRLYDVMAGEDRPLTAPSRMGFTVSAGDWSVAPDGQRILFLEARDQSLYVVELNGEASIRMSE